MRRRIAQQALGFANIGLAVEHIARAKVAVHGMGIGTQTVGGQVVAQQAKEDVERGAVAHRHVIDLIQCRVHGLPRFARNDGLGGGGGQQVGLHGVGDIAKVAAGFAVAVDVYRFALQQCGSPFRDDGGIGTAGVLAGAKHVEVTQADGVEPVAARKHLGIQLVDIFGDGVGAEGFADHVFDLGQAGMVAIGAAAGGVGKALDFCVARGNQHVQKAGDVGAVGGDRVFKAAGDAAQGGLVEDVVNGTWVHGLPRFARNDGVLPYHRALTVGQLADVAFDEVEAGPLRRGDKSLHFVEVALVAGGEIIQAHHALVELEQGFQQVAANEACHAGDEPGMGLSGQASLELVVS